MTPRQAMLLAAGLGTRMRPLTEATAKPLLPLGGRPLLDHALDRLADAGVELVVVNAHWQASRVEAHLAARQGPPRTLVRHETDLLDTGGAVAAAIADGSLSSEAPAFVVNGDSFWMDGPVPTLGRLASAFDPQRFDAVLLVHRTFQVSSPLGLGDFFVDPWGGVRRRSEREVAPYVYAGIQIVSPALFSRAPAESFSMNASWDQAIAAGRLIAVVHDGLWFHLSRPDDLMQAEHALAARETGVST